VLFFIVRFALRIVHLFFDAVGRRAVTLGKFDPEWAVPTYKLARLAIVALGLIVAYPYIPGSQSAAFKGVSLLLGVVFSLGSSSAISNLVANAIRYTPRGGSITATVELAGGAAHVHVDDTGRGLAPGELEAIFTPFARGAQAKTADTAGLGLGLPIARETLERHGIAVRRDLAGVGRNLQDRYEIGVVNRMAQPWRVLATAGSVHRMRIRSDSPV
jgi:hypothetical protein